MEPASTSEQELTDAVRRGDRAAFGELVRAHQRSVFFLALRMARGDEQLARDVAQKAFLQAWTHRESFRGDASFKTWLLRITSNLCQNELRRAWRRRELSTGGPGEFPETARVEARAFEALASREAREMLREAVDSLPERQRQVAMIRLYEDLSFAEVASICGITANNAKVNYHHAVRNIRSFLAARGIAA